MLALALIGPLEILPILVLLLVVAGIVALVARASARKRGLEPGADRLADLEREVWRLKQELERERGRKS